MSDLYLVLRRRLEDVVDWVDLGYDVLHDARKRRGLSYEAMGRQLAVASKTYERYEKAGRVPRQLLPKVAEVLDLEIEQPDRVRIIVPATGDGQPTLESLRAQVSEQGEQLARIERLLRELADPRSGTGSA
jgi:transcriptional regulator with XRE-family HTH domain